MTIIKESYQKWLQIVANYSECIGTCVCAKRPLLNEIKMIV